MEHVKKMEMSATRWRLPILGAALALALAAIPVGLAMGVRKGRRPEEPEEIPSFKLGPKVVFEGDP